MNLLDSHSDKRATYGMMRFVALLNGVVLIGALSVGLKASTITSLSENFNELTPASSATSVGAFQTINGTNVDIVGGDNGSFFPALCVSPDAGNCIDMDGSTISGPNGNPVGQLESVSEFAAGTYYLSFDLIGSQRGNTASTTVSFGNYSDEFTLASGDTTDGIVSNQLVTLTSAGYLLFVSDDATGSQQGDLLDNVVVTAAPAGVPEPASSLLVGTMLLAGAAALRRRALRSN